MGNIELEQLINQELNVEAFHDYAPNGLQVEGCRDIQRIITGVTASQALLDMAVAQQVDAILVHHGYFWKNESPLIRGMKRNRLATLLTHNINLLAYHLPLDAHPILGNNAQLANILNINLSERKNSTDLLFDGEFAQPLSAHTLIDRIEHNLKHPVLHCGDNAPEQIKRIAWCSGGGQSYIEQAALMGADAFLSGEVSEQTIHVAREMGIHFFAAGHHATERYGIQALGDWLHKQYGLDVTFVDINNPA